MYFICLFIIVTIIISFIHILCHSLYLSSLWLYCLYSICAVLLHLNLLILVVMHARVIIYVFYNKTCHHCIYLSSVSPVLSLSIYAGVGIYFPRHLLFDVVACFGMRAVSRCCGMISVWCWRLLLYTFCVTLMPVVGCFIYVACCVMTLAIICIYAWCLLYDADAYYLMVVIIVLRFLYYAFRGMFAVWLILRFVCLVTM